MKKTKDSQTALLKKVREYAVQQTGIENCTNEMAVDWIIESNSLKKKTLIKFITIETFFRSTWWLKPFYTYAEQKIEEKRKNK